MKTAILFTIPGEDALGFCDSDSIPASAYAHVADVEVGEAGDRPGSAWEIIQNIDSRWIDDPRVSLTTEGVALRKENFEAARRRWPETTLQEVGVRSMAVGDLVRLEDGRVYLCRMIGWKPLRLEGDHYVVITQEG